MTFHHFLGIFQQRIAIFRKIKPETYSRFFFYVFSLIIYHSAMSKSRKTNYRTLVFHVCSFVDLRGSKSVGARAYVLYEIYVLTCFACLRAYVFYVLTCFTCFMCLRAYVLYVLYVFYILYVLYVLYVFTCFTCLCAYMLTCFTCFTPFLINKIINLKGLIF